MIEQENKKFSIKDDFSMLALLIIPVGVAVNFVGGQLASILKLPMYLDTIGTIFVAMLCGPWVGAVTGLLTNIVTGIANPINFAFIPVAVVAGLVTGAFARANFFSVWWKWVIAMIVMGVASILTAAPIVVLMFGGVTGSGASLITATVMAAGANIWTAFIGTEGLFNILDRIVSFLICMSVIKVIPARNLIKFSCGMFYIKDKKEDK
ncbi:MAG: ECF transporter S component [Sphaerochaetaceae bacterium]|nr:ECF transporter S component [Sphaerochaetaceae bacterium]